jgi:hypothetical protein
MQQPRRVFSKLVAPTLVLALASGCSVEKLVEESQREAEKAVEIVCDDCVAVGIYPSWDACEANVGWYPFANSECVIEALDSNRDASRATLECVIELQRDYNDCLREQFVCSEYETWEACEDMQAGIYDCPELPLPVLEAVFACSN